MSRVREEVNCFSWMCHALGASGDDRARECGDKSQGTLNRKRRKHLKCAGLFHAREKSEVIPVLSVGKSFGEPPVSDIFMRV